MGDLKVDIVGEGNNNKLQNLEDALIKHMLSAADLADRVDMGAKGDRRGIGDGENGDMSDKGDMGDRSDMVDKGDRGDMCEVGDMGGRVTWTGWTSWTGWTG